MFDSNITVVRTTSSRRRAFDDDINLIPTASRRAAHISSHVLEDADALRHASRRHDAALLNDITSRLCRLEFDTVKPSMEIAMQTGFRRHIYHNKRPPLSKELRQAIRKDRLRYPWDYTKDNLYRPPHRSKKTPREQLKERMEGDPYPEYDPFALYRPRPKRERKPIENGPSIAEQYAKMTPRQLLAHAKARALTAPTERDPSDDIDDFLRELSRPLPTTSVANYVPYTGNLYDFDIVYDDGEKLNPFVSEKIQSSKADIQAFEKMLNDRQQARIKRPLVHVAAFKRLQDLPRDAGVDGEYDLGLDDYYGLEDEVPLSRRAYPTRTVITAGHHQHSGAGLVSGRPPLPTRVHPRAAKYMMDTTSYDYPSVTSSAIPASYTNLRTRAAECRSKMDHQKVLLDRYLPVHLGPGNDVQYEVEAKYGELAARNRMNYLKMPALNPTPRYRDTYRSSSVPPYRPAQRSSGSGYTSSYVPRGPSCRPPVSDVRKRCREVLCKTKNDPTYYTY